MASMDVGHVLYNKFTGNGPETEFINYFKQMPSRKIAVIIPDVCFWVSVKCMESFCIRSNASLTRFSKIESTALHVNTPWKICSKQKMLSCNGSIGISLETGKRSLETRKRRGMRRSTGLVGRYGARTSLAACDRRAKTALTGSCQTRHFSRRRLGRAAAARVLSSK